MRNQYIHLKEFIAQEFSPHFINQLTSLLSKAYSSADKCDIFQHEISLENSRLLAPLEQERLADAQGLHVQHYLHLWANTQEKLNCIFEQNSKKRPHITITSSRARLTAHRILSPNKFPPNAQYRQTNALSNQYYLPISDMRNDHDKKANQVYLFILHGPLSSDKSKLGFVQIAVPSSDRREYIAVIDVYKNEEYFMNTKTEEIQDSVVITLRSDINRNLS